jgi:hypothetical protein
MPTNNVLELLSGRAIVSQSNQETDKTFYTYQIRICGASRKTKIPWEELDLSEENLELLKKSEINLSNLSLYGKLDEYAQELNKRRTEVEQKSIYVEGRRMATERMMPEILAEYVQLQELALHYRTKLIEEADAGLEEFKTRIRSLLEAPIFGLTPSSIELKVNKLQAKFFSLDLGELLQVKLEEFYRIPSLKEQLETQTEMAQQFASLIEARNREKNAQILGQINEEQRQQLVDMRAGIFKVAKEEMESIVAMQIEALGNVEIGKKNQLVKNKLAKHLSRIETLIELDVDGTFEGAKNKLLEVQSTIENELSAKSRSGQTIENKLQELRLNLQDSLNQIVQGETPVLEVALMEF